MFVILWVILYSLVGRWSTISHPIPITWSICERKPGYEYVLLLPPWCWTLKLTKNTMEWNMDVTHKFNEQSGCLFVVVQTHNPTFVVHWFLINCGSNVNIQWILSVTISKWIMLQCWFYFIFKILLLISAKHHPIMNYWYSHALIYFCDKLLVFCLKKKEKIREKKLKKNMLFSVFSINFFFSKNTPLLQNT